MVSKIYTFVVGLIGLYILILNAKKAKYEAKKAKYEAIKLKKELHK